MPVDFLQTIFNFLGSGRYNSTLPTVGNGLTSELQVDQRGRLLVRVDSSVDPGQAAPRSRYTSLVAGQIGAVVIASPKKLVEIMAQNRSTNERFLHLFDLTTLPTTGVPPKLSYLLPAKGHLSFDYSLYPHEFVNGIIWTVSNAAATYTPSTDLFFVEAVLQDLS